MHTPVRVVVDLKRTRCAPVLQASQQETSLASGPAPQTTVAQTMNIKSRRCYDVMAVPVVNIVIVNIIIIVINIIIIVSSRHRLPHHRNRDRSRSRRVASTDFVPALPPVLAVLLRPPCRTSWMRFCS